MRAIALFAGTSPDNLNNSQENFIVHAQRLRVVSALMSFVVALSTASMAQSQGLTNPNTPAAAQSRFPHGRVMAPGSSIAHAGDQGVRAHTHLQVFVPEQTVVPFAGPPFAGLGFETPASLACVYSLVPRANSCNPNLVFANPTGGFGAVNAAGPGRVLSLGLKLAF